MAFWKQAVVCALLLLAAFIAWVRYDPNCPGEIEGLWRRKPAAGRHRAEAGGRRPRGDRKSSGWRGLLPARRARRHPQGGPRHAQRPRQGDRQRHGGPHREDNADRFGNGEERRRQGRRPPGGRSGDRYAGLPGPADCRRPRQADPQGRREEARSLPRAQEFRSRHARADFRSGVGRSRRTGWRSSRPNTISESAPSAHRFRASSASSTSMSAITSRPRRRSRRSTTGRRS